jgi:hypothetical protein
MNTDMYEGIDGSNDSFPVICIEEKERVSGTTSGSRDTTIFLVYDRHYDDYVLYGKRHDKKGDYVPYSFRCKRSDDLYDFLKYAIDVESTEVYHNIALYNYNNFPLDFSKVTFGFLEEHVDHNYEIFGYNRQKLSRRLVRDFLHFCVDMFNRNASGDRI